jgi:hypothetical protein
LAYYEQRVTAYSNVDYNAHPKAPEDHVSINLRAAWLKASDYYSKLDDSLAYYAATILHPYYKLYCEAAWADKPEWIEANNNAFQALWAQYKIVTRVVRLPRVVSNDIDDAIESCIDPLEPHYPNVRAALSDLDEYERWKRCELRAEKGSDAANNPIKYWVEQRNCYPQLS